MIALLIAIAAISSPAKECLGKAEDDDAVFGCLLIYPEIVEGTPALQRAGWTASVCFWQGYAGAARGEIKTAKKYARETGVLDYDTMYGFSLAARQGDKEAAYARKELKALKGKAIKCKGIDTSWRQIVDETEPTVCLDCTNPDLEGLGYSW